MIVALLMSVLLGFASFSLDWFRIRAADQQIQYAADAAALGAVIELSYGGTQAQAILVADAILERNIVGEERGGISGEYTFGQYDWGNPNHDAAWNPNGFPANGIRVIAARDDGSGRGEVPLYLAPTFGGPSSASVRGEAVAAIRAREICVVLDLTGSFLDEMDDAREAVLTFLDIVASQASPGDSICMVTFTGGAELYTPLTLVSGNADDIEDDWQRLRICDFGPEHWQKGYSVYTYYGTYPAFNDAIPWARDHPDMVGCNAGNDLIPGWPADGVTNGAGAQPFWWSSGTNQSAGLTMAREILTTSDNDTARKVIVVISDGEPTCVGGTGCTADRTDNGLFQSQAAQDEGMAMFSVSFNFPFNANQSAYMQSLATPGTSFFYETPASEELPRILEAIARTIPTSLVQ
ncbi:MAG: hypothetical protein ACJAZO_002095 [Myxococcota bacterium]|jgi:hypothetical protein